MTKPTSPPESKVCIRCGRRAESCQRALQELVDAAQETRQRAIDGELTVQANSGLVFHCWKMLVMQTKRLEAAIKKAKELL